MNLLRFIFSKWFLINLGISMVMVFLIYILISWQLGRYTHHGQEIAVPELVGKSLHEVDSLLGIGNFIAEIVDSLYDENKLPGEILMQNPASGSFVKENRRIYLTINTQYTPTIQLPELINQSARQVEATIPILGLKVGEHIYKTSPYHNLVLDVLYNGESVGKGGELPMNAVLSLVIGQSGSLPLVDLPSILDRTLDEADSLLIANNLELGLTVECLACETELDSLQARVYRTNPQYKPGKQVRLGSTIDVWLTNEPISQDTLNTP
jgi:beta-lactam-binding protein with PASTA domain